MSSAGPHDYIARRMLALGVWGGLGSVAVVLLGRSAAGELDVLIGPVMSCVVATFAAALSLYAWWQDHLAREADDPFACALRGVTALAPPAVIGLVLVRDSAAALTYLLALAVIAVVAACDLSLITRRRSVLAPGDQSARLASNVAPGTAATSVALPGVSVEQPIDVAAPLDDPDVSQAVTRRTTPESDSLEALLRVRFDPGQREVALHIPIWPAMAANPEVECEPLDASDVELRVSSAHTYGVRLEARRPADEIQQPGEVPVGVTITSAPAATNSPDGESPDIRPMSA
jgi:hypothetical protein